MWLFARLLKTKSKDNLCIIDFFMVQKKIISGLLLLSYKRNKNSENINVFD
jgi:hypothetical protein